MSEPTLNDARSAIEWWSFDAVSDDGADVLSVRFFNSHIFARDTVSSVPAVSFVYSIAGKQTCRAVIESAPEAFEQKSDGVTIGDCSFRHETTDYGRGTLVVVSLPTRRGKTIEARIEWLSVAPANDAVLSSSGCGDWRIDSSRSDVSGRVSIVDSAGRECIHHFRGTGSHCHYVSRSETLGFGSRLAGVGHFIDSTVFFCREGELLSDGTHASVSVVGEADVSEALAASAEHYWTRTRYGIKYPRRFLLAADDMKLRVKLLAPYESELCFARFPAEMTLTLPDEKQRKAIGCVEVLEPRRMESKLVRWFSGLGVSRAAGEASQNKK
jgi:hypothetical protein